MTIMRDLGMRCLAIALLATVPATSGAQRTKPPTADDQALVQTNATLLEALRTGDSTLLPALLAEDLAYTDQSGVTQSKGELLANVSRGYRLRYGAPQEVTAHVDRNVGLIDYQTTGVTEAGDTVLIRTSAVYVMRASRWQLTSQSSTGSGVRTAVTSASARPVTAAITSVPATVGAAVRPIVKMERAMTARATGTFDVTTNPIAVYNDAKDALLARMSIDKRFHGILEATSKGEMLSAGTQVKGSAGYVAIEYVTGTLGGRKGSFALQHTGTMNRGAPSLSVTVIPDSGTGELKGLTGSMNIIIEGGKHSYEFDYSLPRGGS